MSAAAMKPSEALRKARELITPEGAWMQGYLVSKKGDLGVPWHDQEADCHCSYGAILLVTDGDDEDELFYLKKAIDMTSITKWNDASDRTHAEVLDAFDRAAALAEAEGK